MHLILYLIMHKQKRFFPEVYLKARLLNYSCVCLIQKEKGREAGREERKEGKEKNTDTFIWTSMIKYYRLINL